jgi:integrase
MPTLVKPVSKRKGQSARTSNVFHIRYHCPIRRRSVVISTQCRNRTNAQRLLLEFVDLLERGEVGLQNPFLIRRRQRVEEASNGEVVACLIAFESDLRAGRVRRGKRAPVSKAHADLVMARVRRIVVGCRIGQASELSTEPVNKLFDQLQSAGELGSNQTRKHYERAVKSFSHWLATTGRLDRDPLGRLEVTGVAASDVIHDRGAFRPDEIERIAAAAWGGSIYMGLSGPQRSILYLFAACTGLRAKECAAVTAGSFGPEMTFVRVSGEFTKNGKEAIQPLPSFIRPGLAAAVAELANDEFVWPGGWKRAVDGRWIEAGWISGKGSAEFLRRDAAVVGIVIGRIGHKANGGRVLDFHSFRHSYVSSLERAGLSEGLSRKLARASCRSILDRYTHREFQDLIMAVETMPAMVVPLGDTVQLEETPAGGEDEIEDS